MPHAHLGDPGLDRRWLLLTAALGEARAVCRALNRPDPSPADHWRTLELTDRVDLVLAGVGKSNAAGAAVHAFRPDRHAGLINLGICGALPIDAGREARIGQVVLAERSVLADEGAITPDGFEDVARMGFPPLEGVETGEPMGVRAHPDLLDRLAPLADARGTIACVSVCAGTDAWASSVARRTGAIAEAMEGAAAGLALARLTGPGTPFAEIRVVSNTTGDRARQRWDLPGSFDRLARLAAGL